MKKLLIAITFILLCVSITPLVEATETDYPTPVEPAEPPSFGVIEQPVLPSVPDVVVVPPPPPEVPILPDVSAAPALIALPEVQALPGQPDLPAIPVGVPEPMAVVPPEPVDIINSPAAISAPPVVTLPEEPVAVEVPEEPGVVEVPEEPVAVEVPEEPVIVIDSEFAEPQQAVTVEEALELAIAPEVEVTPDTKVLVDEVPVVADKEIVEVIMSSPEPVTPEMISGPGPVASVQADPVIEAEEMAESEIVDMLGEDTVASMVAQPDIPQELRPSGIPLVLPGRVTYLTKAVDDGLLLTDVPGAVQQKEPLRPPQLLPLPGPEPGVVYIAPFVSVMVPKEVSDRIFDQFVDGLIREGETLGLEFVIIKKGVKNIDPKWLASRKYVTGEIYAYVEDSGCCSTDMRAKARITYRRPQQETPAFGFEYPVTNFFDHDQSGIATERIRLADDIATTLVGELVSALQN